MAFMLATFNNTNFAGYGFRRAQSREDPVDGAADLRLNKVLNILRLSQPHRLAHAIRLILRDPSQVGKWEGPKGGNPGGGRE